MIFQVLLLSQSAPCGRKTLVTPREVVGKVSKSGWLLVKQNTWEQFQLSMNRQRRGLNQMGSHYCNWTVDVDDNRERNPRFLSKAKCNDCPWYCKPVYYEHRVLVRDCANDMRTHKDPEISVWKWETITLEVAYVYKP